MNTRGPSDGQGWDFFISYTAADRAWAEWIAWQLEDTGYQVLIQAWDFVPGAHWMGRMEDGVRSSRHVIAVLSHAYLDSVYGRAEWEAAFRTDPTGQTRKVIPIRIQDCPRPPLLDAVVSFDLYDPDTASDVRTRLLDGIAAALDGRAKPAVEPLFPGAATPPTRHTEAVPSLPGRSNTTAPTERAPATAANSPVVPTLIPAQRRWRRLVATAASAVLTLIISGSTSPVLPVQNSLIRNPSSQAGGELHMVLSRDTDRFSFPSFLDPATGADSLVTVNFDRILNRTLLTFRSTPGPEGFDLVGDLAKSRGIPSSDARTWTYYLRPGILFDDGTPVRADDVRYAIERSFASGDLGGRTTPGADVLDFRRLLYDEKEPYPGPALGRRLDSISTPNDLTIVFHLSRPCADWDRYMALPVTAPVPRTRDTGTNYGMKPASTGPYKVDSVTTVKGEEKAVLGRNPRWDPDIDHTRSALPDKITIRLLDDQKVVDNAIINGDADVDIGNSGFTEPERSRIIRDPQFDGHYDLVEDTTSRFLAIIPSVAPLDNAACRQAIFHAVDMDALLEAFGGGKARSLSSLAIDDILTPPLGDTVVGRFPYGEGLVRRNLDLCGRPDGFSINFPVPDTVSLYKNSTLDVANAFAGSLKKFGINVNVEKVNPGDYYQHLGRDPEYVKQKGWGVVLGGIEPLITSPYGYFWAFHSDRPEGASSNVSQLFDRELDSLIDRASSQTDPGIARKEWEAVNEKLLDLAIVLPVAQTVELRMASSQTTNIYPLQPLGQLDFAALGVQS